VQHDLFDLGGEVSIPGHAMLGDEQVARLEAAVEAWNADLPALKEFILPGGTRASSLAHIARTVCRRAERRVVSLQRQVEIPALVVIYLNRLSDLLFMLARVANVRAGAGEVTW